MSKNNEVFRSSCRGNFDEPGRKFDYLFGTYEYMTVEQLESISVKDILNGIGRNGNHTYNCSLSELLGKKYGKLKRNSVVKFNNAGFAIKIKAKNENN